MIGVVGRCWRPSARCSRPGITAIAALLLFTELSTLEALMLGSTVAATDAAAVFAVLRGSTLRRKHRADAGGRVRRQRPDRDPARARLHRGDQARRLRARSTRSGSPSSELAIGAAIGLAVGGLGVIVLRRVTLPSAGLYPVASVAFAGIAYGGADDAARLRLPGGLPRRAWSIGSASSPARRTIVTFHEGLAWVAQLALFLLLGLLGQPARADRDHPRGHGDRDRHRGDRAAAGGAARRATASRCRSG